MTILECTTINDSDSTDQMKSGINHAGQKFYIYELAIPKM